MNPVSSYCADYRTGYVEDGAAGKVNGDGVERSPSSKFREGKRYSNGGGDTGSVPTRFRQAVEGREVYRVKGE